MALVPEADGLRASLLYRIMKQSHSILASLLFSLTLTCSLGATPALAGLTDTPAEEEQPADSAPPAEAQPEATPAEQPADKPKKEKKAGKEKAKKEKQPPNQAPVDPAAPGGATDKEVESVDDKKVDEAKPKKAKSTVPLPTRVASFLVGAPIGLPVMMVKRTVHQTKAGNRDFIGDRTNPLFVIPATVISLPFGAVGGFCEGWQYSIYNSWKASGEEPFSKESMSLED